MSDSKEKKPNGQTALKVKTVDLAIIKPYWRNPRINNNSVAAVKASIEQYGYNQPIAVDNEMTIVVGHTRHKALQQLGFKKVQVIILDGLPPSKLKAYRIADNKAGENSQWDFKALIPELREITEINQLQVFFKEDLTRFMEQAGGAVIKDIEQADFEAMALKHTRSQTTLQQRRADTKIEFACPHCGELIILDKSNL